jgi:hypothetical protein
MVAKGQAPIRGPFQTLPPEAAQDPNFIPGTGSMFVANQPGVHPPTKEKSILREETQQGLAALAEFQKKAEQAQAEAAAVEPDNAPPRTEIKDTVDQQLDELRGYINDTEQWNVLTSPARKKEVEDRLQPLDISDILIHGEIRQDIVVVPGKLTITLRSVNGEEDLAVKRLMYSESGSDRYMLDKFALMNVAVSIVNINNQAFPTHLDDNKRFNEKLFLKKFDALMKFPIQFLADLGVQALWFDQRVRKLFTTSTSSLKNS